MKLRLLLPSVIFLFCGLVSRAQVTEVLYQGFETDETLTTTVTPSTGQTFSTTLYMSGARSLQLVQSTTSDVTLMLPEIDLTSAALSTSNYISLEFDHICNAAVNSSQDFLLGCIYYKRANEPESQWHQLTNQQYNRVNGGSSDFQTSASFSRESYREWLAGNITNEAWHSERFDLNDVFSGAVAQNERRLMLKFVLYRRVGSAPTGNWYIDNLKVSVSPSPMVRPRLTAVEYPDGLYYPNSRRARLLFDATTTLAQGINPDSVYMFYTVGSDPTQVRVPMTPVAGVANRYGAEIPFFGYDTLMRFYCVARDATTNANRVTFPLTANSWVEFRYVRGVDQPGIETPEFTGTQTSNYYPFGYMADGRSEWVYDSATMAAAGYGPGAITDLTFTLAATTSMVTRNNFQIRMKNAPTDYTVDVSATERYPFTTSYMHIVYDSALTINAGGAGNTQTITLQDTFYYGGKDLVMQFFFDGTDNTTGTSIRQVAFSNNNKRTIWKRECDDGYGYNAFTAEGMSTAEEYTNMRPALVMNQHKNLPLLYDMGVSELIDPSYTTAMTQRPGSLTVKLENFGALTVNGIRVSYNIDDTVFGHYDWSGSMAAGSSQNIVIANNIVLPAGFHTLKVWVEDTLTAGGVRYRDHEPYNDTSFSEFIVCDGPMNGVRNIGGPNPHFNTIDEFLFSLSRCGIDDSLIVRLAPGVYAPFTLPQVNGISQNHYIAFEPQGGAVSFVSTGASSSIINLANGGSVHFRNISFVRRSGALTDMITYGTGSDYSRLENCSFIDSLSNPSAAMRINAMVNSGLSSHLTIDRCTFEGGRFGVDFRGTASDNLAVGNVLTRSIFRNQYESAVNVQYQSGVVVDSNQMYDVESNTSYVIVVNTCSGASRITRNKLYTSHGAGAIGVSGATGTAATHFLIANNMAVCNDNGGANLVRSTFNIIQAAYADVVYNSVKLSAPTRSNVAAATFGGGTLTNSSFVNNVVVSLDYNSNYALNYTPGTSTNNTVGHNVYFSLGTTLNRYAGTACADLTAWQNQVPSDVASIVTNPNFLNGSLVDLRTYNRAIKGVGIPIASVTRDMFDSLRNTAATCPGAFEFVSLGYDFEPEALLNPLADNCHMPAQSELVVLLRNSGVNSYSGGDLSIGYQVNGGAVHTASISTTIPAEDTVSVPTGAMLQLPANGLRDSTYTIRVWTIFANDPNQTNDTATFTVVSRYSPAKLGNDSVTIDYATTTTLTPTLNVEQWPVYNHTSAPQRPSEIYWYLDSTDAQPFFVGPSFTTDTVRGEREYYIRQRRQKPIVRITQLEFARGNANAGLTPVMPYWINSGRKVALQLTNVGDARANLFGDTIQTISPTSNINNKVFRFADSVFLEPGQSLVVQWATGTSANPEMTIHTGTPLSSTTIAYNSNVAIVYRHAGVIEDAVAMNNITATASGNPAITWASAAVPSYVWTGTGVSVPSNTTAGLVRTGFNGGAADWRLATAADPMFIASNRPEWIRYVDNGCEGNFGIFKVKILAPPLADIDVSAPMLPDMSCGLSMEPVSVRVRNYGIDSVSNVVLNYTDGIDTVTDTIAGPIGPNGLLDYTFSQNINLAYPSDTTIIVTVWANAYEGDATRSNDTNSISVTPLFTPAAPPVMATRQVDYDSRDTVTLAAVDGVTPVWFDLEMNPIDTGYTHVSEIIYGNGTYGYGYVLTVPVWGMVGQLGTVSNNTGYPSPFQPSSKFVKQQYIYSASELRALGFEAGSIDTLAFYLDTILGTATVTSVSFDDYHIGLGLTSDTIFASTTSWKATTEVFHRAPMVFQRNESKRWHYFPLDSPFYWDGESSLVVQVAHQIATAYSSGVRTHTDTKTKSSIVKTSSSALSPSVVDFTGTAGSTPNSRPVIRISANAYGCTSPVTPYEVQVVNVPSVDVAVAWPNGVEELTYNTCTTVPVSVNVRNQGSAQASGIKLYYYLDTLAVDSVVVSSAVASGATEEVLIFDRVLVPGRHTVRVIAAAPGDGISSNDTIVRSFLVRFCGGIYSISPTDGVFKSFSEAIDSLNVAGIEGPVTFYVASATYNEQVVLGNVPGSSSVNSISFIGIGESRPVLAAATSQAHNYVFMLDTASHVSISNISMRSRPTATGSAGNYGHVFVVNSGSHISIDSCEFRVKGTINNVNASAVVLQGDVDALTFINNSVDSGYYAFRTLGNGNFSSFTITGNSFRNFMSQGINVRNVDGINIAGNTIRSGVEVTGRALTGIYLAQTAGNVGISKNNLVLFDNKNGGKRGIQLEHINASAANPAMVVNNMISCYGTGSSGNKPAGIWIDSTSSSVYIHFNTIRVYGGEVTQAFSENSYGFYSGTTVSDIHISNNIFSNFSKGYATYVAELNTVVESNFNAYYTLSSRPFYWKTVVDDLAALQTKNSDDGNSVFTEPYFAADDDLHLVMTNVAGIGYYLSDVPDDFDGRTRNQIPGPTIGAHEMTIVAHDVAVIRIIEPVMPANLNFNYTTNRPPNIESDSVLVIAEFYNNGQSPETDAYWYAYIEGHETETRSPNIPLGALPVAQSKLASTYIPTVLGITDTNRVRVVIVLPADSSLDDNQRTTEFFLAPAYNLTATRMASDRTGCNLTDAHLSITIKNVGFKDIDAGTAVKIGYHPIITQPAGVSISTMPDTVEETVVLTEDLWAISADLLSSTTLTFSAPANLYPTDTAIDIKVRLRGWVKLDTDVTVDNDTTSATVNSQSPVIDAYYSPAPPVGYDTILPYGTWGEVRASQENRLAISWYRDTLANPFYHPSAYNSSVKWSNTPQYFSDSVYFINCKSSHNCYSAYAPVWVRVAAPRPNDVAMEAVLAPLGGRVYMENDTVRVRIANYGTLAKSNIPVTFQLKRGNNVIQEVTETCATNIAAGQTHVYTFATLLQIPTPTQTQSYTLNVWTDLAADETRRNDTLRNVYTFRSLAESTYSISKSKDPTFDITRVSFNEIDFDISQQGRSYTNLASYAAPDYPVLHVRRGLSDSIFIEVTALDPTAQSERVLAWVYIDFDRNGNFNGTDEAVVPGEIFYDRQMLSSYISISNNASYGFMRMRVVVGRNSDFAATANPTTGIPEDMSGHVIDFLLYVDPDPIQTDLAVAQIVSPRNYIIDNDTPVNISFRVSNKGLTNIDNPTFYYRFDSPENDSAGVGTIPYNGSITPGASAIVNIPPHVFPYGTSDLTIWYFNNADANRSNDTLRYQYNRFYVVEPPIDDDFDIDERWYAPKGYNNYTRNYWELGTPTKTRLNAAYSAPRAWVTDLHSTIVTGTRGNVSYLYSPIIDIHQIRIDTITVRIRRNLTNKSSLRLEFYNFEGQWENAYRDSLTHWYNNSDDECFDGTTNGSSYDLYYIPTNYRGGLSGDFNERLQFRFVYTTPVGSSATAAFGEGCAIDNFRIGRAARPVDIGIVSIIEPSDPAYGQTLYPKVLVRNYGTDTITSIPMGYIHYGTYLPKESLVPALLPPGATDTFTFTAPFVISSDFPDTFSITAFTMYSSADIYRDNDSATRTYVLRPLDNDISAHSFLYPLDKVVAGDSIQITMRIRNFGASAITHATATYLVNDLNPVSEELDFNELLGRPLSSLEYFNYTFKRKYRAPMGILKLTGIIKSEQNDYIYNDTITKRVDCVTSITDIAARAVVLDGTPQSGYTVSLIIDNRGARGANNFEVGFFTDGNEANAHVETFSHAYPLAALATDYHTFSYRLPARATGYSNVKAYVNVPGDNDASNDTTDVILPSILDLEALKVVVIENSQSDCRVYVSVRNNGNTPFASGVVHVDVTINGETLSQNFTRTINAGSTVGLFFDRHIAKAPGSSYSGSARLTLSDDAVPENNQTSIVEVRSSAEGVPVVEVNDFVLDQNFPNPHEGVTTVPFSLPFDADVRFFVVDAMGHVLNSFSGFYPAGEHSITLDLSGHSSGVYYYGIEVEGVRRMRKMILR